MEAWIRMPLRYLQVSRRAIAANYKAICDEVKVPVLAVIKGNAYGHGAVEVAKVLASAGALWFGVEFLEEAIELRKNSIGQKILCLTGPITLNDCQAFIEYDVIPSVYNTEAAMMLNSAAVEANKVIKVHLKFDTGMGRFGFTSENIYNAISDLKSLTNLEYEGAFTHFAAAFDAKPDYTLHQLAEFQKCLTALEDAGINVRIRHAANSVGAMDFPQARMDMVRVGGALFGTSMFKNKHVRLEKVALLRAQLLEVRNVPKGAYIGYGHAYRASVSMKIGVIPLGYFEGLKVKRVNYAFHFSDLLRALYHDVLDYFRPQPVVFKESKPLDIVGRIGLQLSAVNVSGLDVKPGDEVNVAIDPIYLDASIPRVYVDY